MESIGARLKKRRLEKGLTLEEAHKETHIHINILRAIEEDSLINISPIYMRGFLKNYCKYLGEDPVEYITDYKESQVPVLSKARKQPRQAGELLKVASGTMLKLKPRIKVRVFTAAIFGIAAAILLFHLGKVLIVKVSLFLHRPRRPAVATVVRPAAEARAHPVVPPAASRHEIALPQTAAAGVKLTVYARENCFIEVRSDGKLMFKGRLKKGRSDSWPAKNKIELSVSNAAAVDLQINSKHIANLGTKGQPLRNILITKDSLVVPR